MKIKIGIIVLATVCIGLLVGLFITQKAADTRHTQDAAAMLVFSNQLDAASNSLNDLHQVNLVLTNDLSALQQEAAALSNHLEAASTALTSTKVLLAGAEGQIVNLNGRVNDLEAQNKALDERAGELAVKIAMMNAQIATTQLKLASAQGDNAYLTAELKKQMAEKAELERKFNDLNAVRAQVKKLKDEAFVARRLQWMKDGADPSTPPKGGTVLMQRSPAKSAAAPAKPAPQYDLNVEVGSDGSVHVIPPAPGKAAP